MCKFYRLTVSEIKKLTEDSVKITFALPEFLKKIFSYEAGQYLTLQQDIDNQKIRRAYSICSGVDETELSVAVKRIPNGIFSTYATTKLKKGDILEVMPPEGRFVFLYDIFDNKDIVLFSAGSGVTPMMSIAKTALTKTNVNVVFVYGNKTKEDSLFFDEIEQLRERYSNRFWVHYVFSQQVWGEHISGRIDNKVVDFIFQKYSNFDIGYYYLCGPNRMISNVKEHIINKGIHQDYIFTELFEVTSSESTNFSHLQGEVIVSCVLKGEEKVFQIPKNQSLLEGIRSQGIDVPYSCLNGVCSSCIGKITEGEARMAKNETLVEKEISEGLILTCQAYAVTDKLKIEYDI
ncbi:2Fe-2S iron-sulfur cluster-binding protein [Capnocytophaga cynodegmi]|uniref:2Fe-2S iron-sulfur cluster-binding protein n=1 Tax=Capnocytophaga cynodegmi TaxID=28189 RepID=UPI001AD0CD44|nr:2Fe-2S iron-sulfur cluster-binding protein [Capnocytophaga cynodegmi]GIM54104.1 flavodoxin reductase [Capnocytophaga cynodegmi]